MLIPDQLSLLLVPFILRIEDELKRLLCRLAPELAAGGDSVKWPI